MAKYSVQLINKEVVSVKQTDGDAVPVDTILEKTTGETIWATIEANSDEEAKEKAAKVAAELQSRGNKTLNRKQPLGEKGNQLAEGS